MVVDLMIRKSPQVLENMTRPKHCRPDLSIVDSSAYDTSIQCHSLKLSPNPTPTSLF